MYLNDNIESHFRIDLNQKKALSLLGINKIYDLLYYFPTHYTDTSNFHYINNLKDGDHTTVIGTISNLKTKKSFKSKIPMGEATITDITGKLNIIWFHQPYLAKMINSGSTVRVTGKISETKYGLTLTNPEISKDDIIPIDLNDSLFTKKENTE